MAMIDFWHPTGQQPAAALGQHPIDQLWWERTGQRADRDPIPEPLRDRRLDLTCPWHRASSTPSTKQRMRTIPHQTGPN
jgi:hypothetical protein